MKNSKKPEIRRSEKIAKRLSHAATAYGAKDFFDRVIKEVRDFEFLRELIERRVNEASSRFNKQFWYVNAIVIVVGFVGLFFGWEHLVDRATNSAVERISCNAVSEELMTISGMAATNVLPTLIMQTTNSVVKEISTKIDRQLSEALDELNVARAEFRVQEMKIDAVATVFSARAGSREDFDKLSSLVWTSDDAAKIALKGRSAIIEEYKARKYRFGEQRPILNHDGIKFKLEDFVQLVHADYDFNCDGAINELVNTGRKEFVATLIYAVEHSKRLDSVYYAITGIERLVGKTFEPLDVEEVLNWWNENSSNNQYHSPYEFVFEFMSELQRGFDGVDEYKRVMIAGLEKTEKIFRSCPDHEYAAKMFAMIVSYSSFNVQRFDNGRKELYAKALEVLQRSEYKYPDYVLFHLYYTYFFDRDLFVYELNNKLHEYPELKNDIKKCSLFGEDALSHIGIVWGDISGEYAHEVRVKIVAGSNLITDCKGLLPEDMTSLRLSQIVSGVCAGDKISWKSGKESCTFSFDGKLWYNTNGSIAMDQVVPLDGTKIRFDRFVQVNNEVIIQCH